MKKFIAEHSIWFVVFVSILSLGLGFVLSACQAAEQLDAIEPTFEAALETDVAEDFAPDATEEPATPEPETLEQVEVQTAYEPVFEPTDCWWSLPESQPVECGYLVVPEDRSDPDSPDIRLAVAILRHPGGNPEPDPIIRLHGGPGGGYLKFMTVAYPDDASLFPANRDVIAFDQRGVGLSEPALECPNIGDALMQAQDYEIDGQPLTADGYQEYLATEAAACFAELSKIADLSAYNTKESAADVNDLRIALGYDEVNLHGSSYGTALAQHVMRDFPEHIRSVILDAAISPFMRVEPQVPMFQEALKVTFDRCAADEACNTAFPNLREKWLNVLAHLNENPGMLDASNDFTGEAFQVRLNGANATLPLRFMQASTDALPLIPLYIDLVSQGDYAIAAQQWGGFAARVKGIASLGANLSISCNTIRPLSSEAGLAAAVESVPEVSDYLGHGPFHGRTVLSMCQNWPVESAPAEEMTLVESTTPTLIIRGAFDPATRLDDSLLIADNLSNSIGPYNFPAMGHIVGLGPHPCPVMVEVAFLNDPLSEPDISCISQMDDPEFVLELGGTGEIELVTYTGDMFESVVPAGWNELQPGMFARSDPAVDKTLFAQLAAPAEYADEMVGEVLGEFGLTSLPDPLRKLPTDALTWDVYLPAGAVPMIIAKAETEQATYLLVLVASKGELDPLTEAVLVPAIMAFTPTGIGEALGFSIDPTTPIEAQMQAILDQAVEMGTPGVAVYVQDDIGQVWLGASGKANLERDIALAPEDQFWIGSSSKAFLATVVLQLVEEGVLSLDDPIGDWLDPNLFAGIPNGEAITIRMLLNHTSGIYGYLENEEMVNEILGNPGRLWEPQELLQGAFPSGSPYAEPGGELSYYSNTNYVLLGLIIEQATGAPLATEIRQRILTPLKLEDTYVWDADAPGDHISGYSMLEGELVDATILGLSWAWATGGMGSNVEDTATFSKALFQGELFQQTETLDEMLTFVERYNRPGGYGLGVIRADFISENAAPFVIDGNLPGFVSASAHWPNTGETVVVFLNTDDDRLKYAILQEIIQTAGLGQ